MPAALTEKQRRFVEAYMGEARGNATEAAALAGYKGNRKTLESVGRENLGKPRIAEAIAERQDADPLVASREERQRFWTDVMRGNQNLRQDGDGDGIWLPAKMEHRLKASELLAKTGGDFGPKGDADDPIHVVYDVGIPGVTDADQDEDPGD